MDANIELISKIIPKNDGEFPIVEDVNVEGGFQVRDDITDRNAIPSLNRKEGMLVYVNSTATTYRLVGGIADINWVAESTPSSFLNLTAGVALADGELLRINSSGEAVLADAGSGTIDESRTIGASSGAYAATATANINATPGTLVPTKFGSAPAGASNGSPVYLSSTVPGEATLTPPSGSGDVIFLVGILQGADGASTTPTILFQPQFISVNG